MVSVVTCTYNRCISLCNVYKSLQAQDNKAFDWVIYDDGSTDDTEKNVYEWMKEQEHNEFRIKYVKGEENLGFARAWNNAIKLVDTEYFIFCDSNKILTTYAIGFIYKYIDTIIDSSCFAGVAGMRAFKSGEICGGVPCFKGQEYIDVSNLKRYKYGLGGDKAEIYKTELVKRHLLPCFEGEKFATEAICFDAIASDGYVIRWFPSVLCIGDYEADGLTQSGMNGMEGYIKNYRSFCYYVNQALKIYDFIPKCKLISEYYELEKCKKHSISESSRNINISNIKLRVLYFEMKLYRLSRLIDKKRGLR